MEEMEYKKRLSKSHFEWSLKMKLQNAYRKEWVFKKVKTIFIIGKPFHHMVKNLDR
jgi:hypothetical protein